MMTNEKENVINEITELREKFRDKWGKSVFDLPIPNIINNTPTLEQLLEILRNIVNTGESIQEGYIKYILKRPITINDLTLDVSKKQINRIEINKNRRYNRKSKKELNIRKKESKCLQVKHTVKWN